MLAEHLAHTFPQATGVWSGKGILGPEAFDAQPFLDLLAGPYASPWEIQEHTPTTCT